ncbi:MAG TPA: DUF4113 domain-containing protein [Acidovorax temperans]|nr:DUF4113 domain-containing protein [Acidovorax temperans]
MARSVSNYSFRHLDDHSNDPPHGGTSRGGTSTVKQGSAGTAAARRDWAMRLARRTPQYTTDWRQVPVARA